MEMNEIIDELKENLFVLFEYCKKHNGLLREGIGDQFDDGLCELFGNAQEGINRCNREIEKIDERIASKSYITKEERIERIKCFIPDYDENCKFQSLSDALVIHEEIDMNSDNWTLEQMRAIRMKNMAEKVCWCIKMIEEYNHDKANN